MCYNILKISYVFNKQRNLHDVYVKDLRDYTKRSDLDFLDNDKEPNKKPKA